MGVGTNLDTVWGIGKGRFDVTDPSTLTLSNERPSEDHDLSSSPTRSTSSSFQPSAQRTGISLHGFAHVAGGQTHCYLVGTCNVNAGILIAARSGLRTLPVPNIVRINLTYWRTTTSCVPHGPRNGQQSHMRLSWKGDARGHAQTNTYNTTRAVMEVSRRVGSGLIGEVFQDLTAEVAIAPGSSHLRPL